MHDPNFNIGGRFTMGDAVLSNQEIQLLDADHKHILATVYTNDDGNFGFSAMHQSAQYNILYKLRTQNHVGAWYQQIEKAAVNASLKINVDEFIRITIQLITKPDYLQQLAIFMEPVQLNGLPNELIWLLPMKSNHVASSTFYKATFTETVIELMLQKGQYFIGGEYILEDRNNPGVIVTAVNYTDAPNEKLEGSVYRGFKINAFENRRITMQVEAYKDL